MFFSPLTAALEIVIIAIAGLYLLGAVRVWRRAGWGHGLAPWRAACFLGGMLILGAALAAPMDRLADHSFAAHMFQHVLLMKLIPPMLVLGEFSVPLLHAVGGVTAHRLGSAWTRSSFLPGLWSKLTSPWFAWSFLGLSLWIWHVPPFYEAALGTQWLHVLEHAMFFSSSLLFWWYILQPGRDRAIRYGAVVLFLFTTLFQESALGALLTFSAKSWYQVYAGTDPWGLSPLSDQQVAGMIMWIPGGLLFGFLMVYYFGAWLKAIERRMHTAHPEYAPIGDRHD